MSTLRITLILLLMTGFSEPARAVKVSDLPLWAQSLVDSAFQSGAASSKSGGKDPDAVCLLDEGYVRFDEKTAYEDQTRRVAIKILTGRGRGYAEELVPYNSISRVKTIKAWTVKANGRIIDLKADDIEDMALYPGFVFYSDSRSKAFRFPEAAPGDLVVYEITTIDTHPAWTPGFSGLWGVQRSIPVRLSRFTLELPLGWGHSYRIYNMADKPPQKSGTGVFVWEWRDVEPQEDVAMARSDLVGGRLIYNCVSNDARWLSRNRATWDDHAANFATLAWPRLVADAAIKAIVADLTKNCVTDVEKIHAIANHVRSTLTYVAIAIGVGGYQPHPVQEIFKNKYGDCKDMSALLISMLREAGITAYPVLIRTIDQGAVDPEFPVPGFNHAIAFVPVAQTSAPWVSGWPAHDPFGRGLWIDCTWETCSIQDLPWTVQGAYGLVVTPDKGYLIQTPVFGPERNMEKRVGQVALATNGDMTFEGMEEFRGVDDMIYKSRLRSGSDQDRLEWIQRRIGASVARCNLEWFRHSPPTDLDTPTRLDFRFTSPRYMNSAGNLAFFRPNVLSPRTQNPFSDTTRTLPVFYEYPYTEVDSLTFVLPETYQIDAVPPPVSLKTDFGSFDVQFAHHGDTLIYVRRLQISKREIPAEAYEELQKFYQNMIKVDKTQVTLKRRPTAQQRFP